MLLSSFSICSMSTPYREPVWGPIHARFNRHHSRARCIIETSFGRVKARRRAIFFQTLPMDQLIVPKVETACTMHHNICLGTGDVMDEIVLETTRSLEHVAEVMRSARREELATLTLSPEHRHNVLCRDTMSCKSIDFI